MQHTILRISLTIKRKMNDGDRERLKLLGIVSKDKNACLLAD